MGDFILKNKKGFLLADSLVALIILSTSVLLIIISFSYISQSYYNAKLKMVALNEYEIRLYTNQPNEQYTYKKTTITFYHNKKTYCMSYKDLFKEQIEICI